MPGFAQLKGPARAYVVGVVVAGAAAVAYSTVRLYQNPLDPQWIVIAALTLLTGSFSVKIASINARISVSEAFVFLAVLLFGAAAGTITVLLEALTVLFWMSPAGRPLHRLLFNLAAPTIAIWLSATVFFLFSDIEPYSIRPAPLSALFIPCRLYHTVFSPQQLACSCSRRTGDKTGASDYLVGKVYLALCHIFQQRFCGRVDRYFFS